MDCYLYYYNRDERVKCGKEILNLERGDLVTKDGILYEVIYKELNLDEKFIEVNISETE